MSDVALPRSLRMIEGFGVHTFRLVNAEGRSTFVKFHWRPKLGAQATCWDEAVKISGADPDHHRRDLWEAIARGDFPEWSFGIQAFDEDWAAKQPYDVLDPTKLVPEEDIPVEVIGRMVLDRNPDNVFAETEQAAFLLTNIIPGIEFSNDLLLQGRLFSYLDTQKSRLGTSNFHQLPINAPICPMANFQRDGMMQTAIPKGRANYEPNSLADAGEDGGPRAQPKTGFRTLAQHGDDNVPSDKLRIRAASFADHFSQARMFYRSQTRPEQAHIAAALVFELSKVQLVHVRSRTLAQLRNVDEDLARRVADGLAMPLPAAEPPAVQPLDMKPSDRLSLLKKFVPTLAGRKVGILFDEGSDLAEINAVKAAIERAGATAMLIAPKVGGIKVKGGTLAADGQLAGTPSVLLDAVALVLTKGAATELCGEASAVDFVSDAFVHLKAIGHTAGAKPLLDKAGVTPDEGITSLDSSFISAAARRFPARESSVRILP